MPYSEQALMIAKRFYDNIIDSPINIGLVALIIYFSYRLLRKDTSGRKNETKNIKLEKMPKRDFTPKELAEYDGLKRTDGRILMGVLGRVFDVSIARRFYGPGNCNIKKNIKKSSICNL
jgi:hypothetical protein